MAQFDRITVTLNTSAEPAGHLQIEELPNSGPAVGAGAFGWRVHCDLDGCTTTPEDFDCKMATVGELLEVLVDHLADDHGVSL